MNEIVAILGCVGCPLLLIYTIYKIVRVFKINSNNSDLTTCKFTYVLRVKYFIITYCVRYDFEYSVDDVVYKNNALVSPLFGFSQTELANGVPVRYLKSNPDCVEFTNMSHGIRVFGWLIIAAGCIIGGFFAFAEVFGL